MSIKLKKIQQSTTAFEFAEGLHGKAGMHSFFDGREHGPYNFTILQLKWQYGGEGPGGLRWQ